MALLPPFFLDCVTAIGFRDAKGTLSFVATGFLYGRFLKKLPENPDQATYRVYLVTNRHVFEGAKAAVLRFNPPVGQPARVYDLDLVNQEGQALWVNHTDPEIDITATSINAGLLREHGIVFSFFHSDANLMSRDRAKTSGLAEGDGVFVLGFPLGDPGGDRNYVVVRHGVIARIQDFLAGSTKYLIIDASIFPGNSGGPVVTRPEAMAITGTQSQSSANLLGVVSAYVPYQDIAISKQTGRPRVIFEENTGLAVVVPIDYVTEVVERAEALRPSPPVAAVE